jgi:hypothetical protein
MFYVLKNLLEKEIESVEVSIVNLKMHGNRLAEITEKSNFYKVSLKTGLVDRFLENNFSQQQKYNAT